MDRDRSFARRFLATLILAALGVGACAAHAGSPPQPPRSEKESRTPAQQKINSQVLYEIYRKRGIAKQKNVPEGKTDVKVDAKGRALIDIRAEVTPAFQKSVTSLGSTIVTTSREYRSIIAWVPLLKIEQLAAQSTVRAIEPAAEATTR
jgi:hypothetical protein